MNSLEKKIFFDDYFFYIFKLALSAASPIWRGYLADIDCRWNILCAMVDDRTAEERGFEVN